MNIHRPDTQTNPYPLTNSVRALSSTSSLTAGDADPTPKSDLLNVQFNAEGFRIEGNLTQTVLKNNSKGIIN